MTQYDAEVSAKTAPDQAHADEKFCGLQERTSEHWSPAAQEDSVRCWFPFFSFYCQVNGLVQISEDVERLERDVSCLMFVMKIPSIVASCRMADCGTA